MIPKLANRADLSETETFGRFTLQLGFSLLLAAITARPTCVSLLNIWSVGAPSCAFLAAFPAVRAFPSARNFFGSVIPVAIADRTMDVAPSQFLHAPTMGLRLNSFTVTDFS